MITLFILLTVLYLTLGIVSLCLKVSFGIFKILFGAGLFFFCPLLFIIALMTGLCHSGFFWILVIAFICFGGRRRAL